MKIRGEGVFKFNWNQPKNLVESVQTRARKTPNQVALLCLENGEDLSGQITYGELDTQARRIAAHLQNQQLTGQPVILFYPTGLDFIAAFMGCLYAGCIAVPASCPAITDFKKSEANLFTLAQDSGALTVLTTPAYVPLLRKSFLELITTHGMAIFKTTNLSNNLLEHYKKLKIDEDSITHLQYTSGSTSAPKGVITRHKNLIQSLKNHSQSWGYDEDSVTLSWTPHSHVYGLLGGLLLPLYHGTLGIIMPPSEFIRNPANWLKAISKYHVSHSGGPNFSYELCVQRIKPTDIEGLDLSRWKVALAAGEPARYHTLQKFTQAFSSYGFHINTFCSAYGMSEATGLIAASTPGKKLTIAKMDRAGLLEDNVIEVADSSNARDIVCSGGLVASLDLAIVNPDTLTLVADGVIGEIWLAGDTISTGYWIQPEETKKAFNNQLDTSKKQYFRTGDLGYLKEGEIFLTGRLKEVIILYGKKYYPQDIETIAAEINKELIVGCDNIVFSIDKNGKEEVIIIQELIQDIDKKSKDEMIGLIRQAISEKLKIDVYGIALVEKNSLARTSNGKLSRKLCQEKYLEGQFNYYGLYLKQDKQSPNHPPPKEEKPKANSSSLLHSLSMDLMNIIATELNLRADEININDSLSQYGFDSIRIANLVANLNNTFGLALNPANLFEYKIVNDIGVDLLQKHPKLFADYYKQSTSSPGLENETPTILDTSGSVPSDLAVDDIAIIGMNGVFPGSPNLDVFWDNLIEGNDLISEIPTSRWDWHDYYDEKDPKTKVKWGGFINGVDQFDARFFSISPLEAELMDPQQRIFLEVVWKTIEDSGCNLDELASQRTGLFVGVSSSDYRELEYETHQHSPYLITGVYHSLLPNRISYLLNLSGTSEAIDTACSSSLVAIHHAIKAIQHGDCDMAIAGGVNINLIPDLFLTFSQAGMLCADGRCKTFDKSANGYVRGEGAGAILLKPLAKARADGDHVYAIIKGSAVNHGGRVNSLTVPNPNAQAAVVVEAYDRANIDIETINFIEAHGTGTPIGDPIEINGLKKAFQAISAKQHKTNRQTNYCGVGSVKTNIGHLEPAAGIAGVIKLLLAMQHNEMPGILHFKELNPFIDVKDSPFYIVNENKAWMPIDGIPRRAGISSFGIGGSNSHVVLEEVPLDVDALSLPKKPAYLITLSAKTLTALKQKAHDLVDWLHHKSPLTINKNATVEQISYTLNHGRQHFNYRYAFVVSSIQELEEHLIHLNQSNALDKVTKHSQSTNASTSDVLEDMVSYEQMSVEEYKNKLLLLVDLYNKGYNLDWDKLHHGELKHTLALPTYPFDKQSYWLAKSTTKTPKAASLHPLIDYNASVFNQQRFVKQLIGSEFYLVDHQVNQVPILPGAVYLEMVRAAVKLSLSHQEIISINNVLFAAPLQFNGLPHDLMVDLHQDENDVRFEIKSLDATYVQGTLTASHVALAQESPLDIMRIKERCTKQMQVEEIYNKFSQEGIAYGSSFQVIEEIHSNENESIAKLKLPEALKNDASQWILHPSLMDGAFQATTGLPQPDGRLFLPFSIEKISIYHPISHLCYVYVKRAISNNETLPKYTIDILDETGLTLVHITNFTLRATKKDTQLSDNAPVYYYKPQWTQSAANSLIDITTTRSILIFDEDDKLVMLLKQKYPQQRIIQVLSGANFQAQGDVYRINPDNPDEYKQLFNHLNEQKSLPECLIYRSQLADSGIKQQLQQSLHRLFYLTQALLGQRPKEKIKFIVVNEKQKALSSLFISAFAGFAKTLHIEQPMIICRMVQIEDNMQFIVDEMLQIDEQVYYDNEGIRWIREYKEMLPNHLQNEANLLKENGVYLITGGMGGLGLLFARYLAQTYHAKIALLGRSTLNERHNVILAELNQLGGTVMYVPVDITQRDQLANAIQTIKAAFGGINGVLHSAGVISDNFLFKKDIQEIDEVVAPKVYGTLFLDELTLSEPLDFFVLFSSIASILGNTGQSDYAYGNRFMDEFAEYRAQNHRQGRSVSINWPLWFEGGMKIDQSTTQWLKETMGMDLLATPDGIAAFLFALAQESTQAIVLVGDHEKLDDALHVTKPTEVQSMTTTPTNDKPNVELATKTEQYLKETLSNVSKIALHEIDSNEEFEQYGIDSLMIVSLNQQLDLSFKDLPKTLFFEYSTLKALTQYFIESHTPTLMTKFAMESKPIPVAKQEPAIILEKPIIVESPQSKSIDFQDIAIIGLSGQYPMADDLDGFWENLKEAKDCITEIPQERWDYHVDYDPDKSKEGKSYSKWGGFIEGVDQFDALFFNISPHEAELIDPQERLFLQTAWNTIEDAGYSKETLSDKQIGVFVGVMYGHYQLFGEDESLKGHTMATISSYASIANRVSYFLNLHGPSMAVDTMCSSSITSIHLACQSILNGECQMAIAGGVNVSIHPNKYIALSQGQFVSSDGRCRSFGEGGDGYVPGEGVGSVLLKPLHQALKDKDHIYGVIKGSSLNHGGKTNNYTVPSPNAQASVIDTAFKNATINPANIGYIEAHGTGTSLGDPIEIAGLTKAFGLQQRETPCPIGSVKSNIGHCESAAGIAAITKVLLQMRHKLLVPSLHSATLNPFIHWDTTPFKVQHELSDWQRLVVDVNGIKKEMPRLAGISSFGAGGSNAHIIIEEAPDLNHSILRSLKPSYLFTLSAKTELSLKNRIINLASWLEKQTEAPSLEDISYTLNSGRSHFDKRCAFVVSSLSELRDTLQALKNDQPVTNAFIQLERKNKPQQQAIFKKLFAQLMREVADVKQIPSEEYRDTLLALANFYIDGYSLDWNQLHANEAMQKIALPTYPFDKERYWVKTSPMSALTMPSLHPLLDSHISISKAQCFTKRFTGLEFYLNDHRIKGNAILPAAAYLEMARAAGAYALPDERVFSLRHMMWSSPIQVIDEPLQVAISLYPGEIGFAFEVTTSNGQLEPIVHAQGKIHYASMDEIENKPTPLAIAEIKQRCTQQKTHEQIYSDFKTAGFNYGPAFQVIDELSSNATEVLARVQLPDFLNDNKAPFVLHPSLLDGVLQATAEFLQEDRGLYLPFSIGQLDIYSALSSTCYVYATSVAGAETMPKFEILVTDEAGTVLIVIKEFMVRAIEQANTKVQSTEATEVQKQPEVLGNSPNETDLRQKTEGLIKNMLSGVINLAPERIKSQETFENYGIDSVMIVKLNRSLEEMFGDLSKTLFFEYGTVATLTDYFIENHSDFLNKKFSIGTTDNSTLSRPAPAKISVLPVKHTAITPFTSKTEVNDIAIIGMSGRFPQANTLDAFWHNLQAGKDSISEIPSDRWDYHADFDPDKTKAGKTYSKWGGFVTDIDKFDPLFFNISPKEAELLDPQERFFLETAWQTVEDAGYTVEALSDKKIGVYVGAMYGEYQLYGAQEYSKGHVTALSSSHASIANRVSYYLNFNGPSIALDTMCSSSLTAIHLACKSIRDGECQLALAGGVNLSIHPNKYILLSQGKFLASDGHCHSFGEGGDGYVPGEGVGAVLLKPLEQALADNDHIYGVIKGSSINHGGRTNGYTVPNPFAQAALIEANFKNTGINPDTISYIEAHGTGTSLGDPIEINGLSKVFGKEKRENPIAIGSVKSNIGHLESAAGIAAVTKVILQMKHKSLVPSIFSQTLNPNINWEKTPFKVQHDLSEWHRPLMLKDGIQQTIPRRAGISAFGAGGSNAHLIVEEAPDREVIASSNKPAYLFCVSAKTQAALKKRIVDLNQWINTQEDIPLEAISYTLNRGRNHFDKRIVLIAASIQELKNSLNMAQNNEQSASYFKSNESKPSEDEAIYEQVLSTTLAELQSSLDDGVYKKKLETLANLYVKGYDLDWSLLHLGEVVRKISLPTYPFAKEHYWIPDVTTFNYPTIGMLSASLHPLLDANISTIETECFAKLLTGKEFYLTDHCVNGDCVLPGAAYLEMARAAGQLAMPEQALMGLKHILFTKPISVTDEPHNVTISLHPEESSLSFEITTHSNAQRIVHAQGNIVYATPQHKPDIDINAVQARCTKTQRPSDMYADFKRYGLHYGPSFQVIQSLANNDTEVIAKIQLPEHLRANAKQFILHPSLLDGALQAVSGLKDEISPESDALYLPFSMGEIDILGALPAICYVYIVKTSAPNAELHKFQIQITDEHGKVLVHIKDFAVRVLKNADNKGTLSYYGPIWEQQNLASSDEFTLTGSVLVFDDEGSITQSFREKFPQQVILRVVSGDEYKQITSQDYQLNKNNVEHYTALFEQLKTDGSSPHYIIYPMSFLKSEHSIQDQLQRGFYPLFHLAQTLIKQKPKQTIRVLCVNEALDGYFSPFASGVSGFAKTVILEHPKLIFGLVNVPQINQQGIDHVIHELGTQDVHIRYDKVNTRMVEGYNALESHLETVSLLKKEGVYLITGGLGGLGLIFARHLATQYQAKLVLIGRSAIKDEQKAIIAELEKHGAQAMYIQADIAQSDSLKQAIEAAKARFGRINGVIHSAGVLRDAFILKKTMQNLGDVLAPKIYGTINLDELTQSEPLDFFMMFSSIASVFGNPGQCDYSYANGFIDEFAVSRDNLCVENQRHGKTIVINWPLWEEGGMQIDEASKESMERHFGLSLLPTKQGIVAFEDALHQKYRQVIVLYSKVTAEKAHGL